MELVHGGRVEESQVVVELWLSRNPLELVVVESLRPSVPHPTNVELHVGGAETVRDAVERE